MQRKRSISQKPNSLTKKKILPQKKKQLCTVCTITSGLTMLMQNALYRKYSFKHFSQPQIINNYMKQIKLKNEQEPKQYMQKYFKTIHRKHQFPRIKEIYKLHHQSPRLFMAGIKDIIYKCQHRKRLLQYFKIAKILGIRVDTIKFSTFMLSLSKSQHPLLKKREKFDPLIGQISGYQFSEEIQRQLIQTLSGKQNNMHQSNQAIQSICNDNHKHQETAASFNQVRLKF